MTGSEHSSPAKRSRTLGVALVSTRAAASRRVCSSDDKCERPPEMFALAGRAHPSAASKTPLTEARCTRKNGSCPLGKRITSTAVAASGWSRACPARSAGRLSCQVLAPKSTNYRYLERDGNESIFPGLGRFCQLRCPGLNCDGSRHLASRSAQGASLRF